MSPTSEHTLDALNSENNKNHVQNGVVWVFDGKRCCSFGCQGVQLHGGYTREHARDDCLCNLNLLYMCNRIQCIERHGRNTELYLLPTPRYENG